MAIRSIIRLLVPCLIFSVKIFPASSTFFLKCSAIPALSLSSFSSMNAFLPASSAGSSCITALWLGIWSILFSSFIRPVNTPLTLFVNFALSMLGPVMAPRKSPLSLVFTALASPRFMKPLRDPFANCESSFVAAAMIDLCSPIASALSIK